LNDFNGQVRYLGPPEVFSNNDVKANKWVGAKLQCTPLVRDWSAAALQADLGNRCSNDLSQTCTANNQCGDDDDICVPLDADTIYYYGAEVVPCSTHAVQQGTQSCVDLANEEDCLSDPLEVRTALWGDIWPIPGGFGANVNFGDIGNEVDAFKGIPFLIGGPDGAANKWRSMLRDNEGAPDGSISFTDIGKTVDAFKTIAYQEAGPTACP
ncbi:MAG: hypothetical protein IIB59_02575, partial [Planctomycetes bacterium]|nr:hypothetical protein [Planctomycetota bacterium]